VNYPQRKCLQIRSTVSLVKPCDDPRSCNHKLLVILCRSYILTHVLSCLVARSKEEKKENRNNKEKMIDPDSIVHRIPTKQIPSHSIVIFPPRREAQCTDDSNCNNCRTGAQDAWHMIQPTLLVKFVTICRCTCRDLFHRPKSRLE
jgi:hypothetical protein